MKGTMKTLVIGAALMTIAAWVPGAAGRSAGTLQLSHVVLTGRVSQVDCPAGSPDSTACFRSTTNGVVRGLGAVSGVSSTVVEDADSSCERWRVSSVLTVSGKGEIDLSLRPPGECVVPTTGILAASLVFTVTGGSAVYAGATGSGTFLTTGHPGTTNTISDELDGSLSVPGLEFDLAPPSLRGGVSKTVRAPRKARVVRVVYKVTGRDAVDGRVPVTCKPRSGSRFRIGRTKVSCSATDSSGNTAKVRFTITVKHR
jgi:HYR domain-containing protein